MHSTRHDELEQENQQLKEKQKRLEQQIQNLNGSCQQWMQLLVSLGTSAPPTVGVPAGSGAVMMPNSSLLQGLTTSSTTETLAFSALQ